MVRIIALLVFASQVFGSNVDTQMVSPYVEIQTASGVGAGVVIDVGGKQVVLTAKHVVDDVTECVILKRNDDDDLETRWIADVVAKSETADLAIVKPRTPTGLTSANLCGCVKLERGEDAWYVGTPTGLHASLDKTIINRPSYLIDDQWNKRKYTFLNGNAWYGNSGGPAFVKRGDDYFVIGIIVRLAVITPRTPMAAERLEAIVEFLEEKRDSIAKSAVLVRREPFVSDRETEVVEKVRALVKVKFGGDYRKAFDFYAGADELLGRGELIVVLRDAGVGAALTRGAWADGIIGWLDKDRSGQLSWEEVSALKERKK